MNWVKRNLFFVIGGILALGLLGAAGFYDYKSWERNSAAFDKLTDIYNKLRELTNQRPSPGNDKISNIEIAKQQEQQLRDEIRQTWNYFQPIEPIPDPTNGPVSSETFANALHRMIDQLQRDATSASVSLPPQYSFSFEAQRSRVKFDPGSLNALATQLGEVRVISEILFAARVNALDGIQRARVSENDVNGPQSDYLADNSVTNDLAVMTPYAVTFRAFSPEIAQMLAGFASSPHGFIVKSINVQPAEAMASPEMGAPPPPVSTPGAPPGKGGLQTALQEQLLRVTIEVEIVKLLPKN
jgi:hypothetical protein